MANEEHLAILRQGVEVWNRWRGEHPDIRPHLPKADLIGIDLRKANLVRSDLSEANLRNADLRGLDLRDAYLYGTTVSGADLHEANLRGVDLRTGDLSEASLIGADLFGIKLNGANLDRADLSEVDLYAANLDGAILTRALLDGTYLVGASLRGTNLKGAIMMSAVFGDNDLSEVIGLDKVYHQGPSTIGIDTLYRSNGKIPEGFLRGCGVPDAWIDYLPALLTAMQPIQFYSCFISYSTKDEDFARWLHGRMRDNNLRVWFADEDMKGGAKLHEQIDQAIRIHDKLVLVLSEHSIQSEWVMTEIRKARKAELRDNHRKLFPIRLVDMDVIRDWECFDADTGKDLAVEVREYFIPDFTHWKDHDSFERAFARFLKDLQATEAPPIPRSVEVSKVNDHQVRPDIDYNLGLERLRALVNDHDYRVQNDFATLEARLLGIIQEERLYGINENTRAIRAQVIHVLNEFVSGNRLAASFTDLCRP